MAKATITVLCPSGHRRKAQILPNNNLLQVLEDMCNQDNLDASEWGLIHQRKKCDVTIPWRLLGVPTNALLEMYKLDERRPISDVTIQLQLPDNTRYPGSFQPTISLREMLDWYRNQPQSSIATFDSSINTGDKLHPVCSYMSEEVIGDYALSNTTLRELGLTSGTAVIRYNHRSITDDELKKISDRIDEKLARRRRQQEKQQQQQTPESPAVQSPAPAPTTTTTTTFNPPPPQPVVNTTVPSFNNDEYSIFRDLPVSRPPATTNQQPRPKTLAEALGINIGFDNQTPFSQQQQQQPPADFSNFKFPEATKGQDLTQSSDSSQRTKDSKPSDRHVLAYDLTTVPTRSETDTEELPDSFFELTPDDLRSVLNSLRQQSSDENPLETQSMRQRTQAARNSAYEYIVIRLVINSNNVLQGLFYPTEPVSHLIEFARQYLMCPQIGEKDFYLYTSPPRVVLSDLNKTLMTYDLAPASYVYLGHRKVSPLVIQLGSNVRLGTIQEATDLVTQYVFKTTNSNSDDGNNGNNKATKRNTPVANVGDKDLRDKLKKFLPGKK